MNFKHGKYRTKAYSIWAGMLSRCERPTDPAYSNYGGRGITVCDRWKDFKNFHSDMGDPPAGRSIERKNNDSGYSPDNCIWATREEQNRNRRGLILITIDGETQPLSAWVKHFGMVSYATAHMRITIGWSPEDAVKTAKVTRSRKGIPRGERISTFGARHGVKFIDQRGEEAA